MRLNRTKRRGGGELILQLTPLIDVVFLLLIFFLVATSFEDLKSGIKIDVPESSIRELNNIKEIQISIAKDKKITLTFKENGNSKSQTVTEKDLKNILSAKLKENKEKNVLITADKDLDYGLIVNVMTTAKEAGATSLDLNTTPTSGKK